MSPENIKPKKILICRTHYPIPDRSNIDENKAKIARKSIIKKYKEIGISLNLEKLTFLK